MKIRKIIIASALLLFVGSVNAVVINCVDTTGNKKNASSEIDKGSSSATTSSTNCGPWSGNESNDLTATNGGYGYNLYDATTDPDGWKELDKADGKNSTIITGIGWGTTKGTFKFIDSGYDDYLIVLKFSNLFASYYSNSDTSNSGFDINGNSVAGGDYWKWDTDTDGDGKFAISHLSVLVRNPQSSVAAPGPLVIMAIGLMGILGMSRVKKFS